MGLNLAALVYRLDCVSASGYICAGAMSGDFERARIAFSADGRTQTITWEWRPKGQWLPLCDRVADRED